MPHIKYQDMRKGLRTIGSVIRMANSVHSEEQLAQMNTLEDRLLKGRWLGRNTMAREEYLGRPDVSQLRILVCTSKKGTNPGATGLLWIHGGGYAIGAPEQDFLFVDPLTRDGNCVTVMPAYTRSTDAPYPAALEDCYLALLWMRNHAEELGINKDQLFVGGDSAGGGLTAALCLYARDRKEVNIAFQMPLYPMLDDRMITTSSQDNDAPVWNSATNEMAWKIYLRSIPEGEEVPIYAAPARATDLSGLPPMCTYVGTIEPFYDETMIYARRMKEQGGRVRIRRFAGCFHAFDLMGYPTKVGREARAFLLETFRYAQEHFFAENE